MSERLEEMLRIARAATKGPWRVWGEPTPDKDAARKELALLVSETEQFCGVVYMLADTTNSCPALTGCGPTSEANAQHIATFNPRTAEALVKVAIEQQRALDHFDMASELYTNDTALAAGMATLLRASLSALTAAMEDSNVG